jgi:hypothetical protein
MPCPTAISAPAYRLRAPITIAAAVTGPGIITPDSDTPTALTKKNNNSIKSPYELRASSIELYPPEAESSIEKPFTLQ